MTCTPSRGRAPLAFLPLAFIYAVPLLLMPAPAVAQSDEEMLELGRTVFLERAEPQCGLCHTLADAGTDGGIGPVLDDMRPSAEVVQRAVANGIGPMRPYTDLSEEEIEAVAFYVASVTGAE